LTADSEPHGWSIELGPDMVAANAVDLAAIIIVASDVQVEQKAIVDPAGRDEFSISTDALNYWRVAWRCAAEWGTRGLDPEIAREVKAGLCFARGYDADDFESALQATRGRARLPFGWTVLDLAWQLARREPIRLLGPELAGRRVPTLIASIAYHLQAQQKGEPILLPIDQIRTLLEQRKIVVSGAVQRLVDAKVLVYHDETYYTGKAREFRFAGVEGEHFAREGPEGV
jgi:hypothetical protein